MFKTGVAYTVCVTIGRRTFTVTLQYPDNSSGYTGSAVEGSCSC